MTATVFVAIDEAAKLLGIAKDYMWEFADKHGLKRIRLSRGKFGGPGVPRVVYLRTEIEELRKKLSKPCQKNPGSTSR